MPGAKTYICFIIRAPAVPWCNAEEMIKHKGKSHDYDAWRPHLWQVQSRTWRTLERVRHRGARFKFFQYLWVYTDPNMACTQSYHAFLFSVDPILENALLRLYFHHLIKRCFFFLFFLWKSQFHLETFCNGFVFPRRILHGEAIGFNIKITPIRKHLRWWDCTHQN